MPIPDYSERTKQLLADTLKMLLETKPFHKITVTELVRTCSVNRQTFYYHFQDIYALLEWILEEQALKLLDQTNDPLDWEGRLRFFLYFIEENFAACKNVVNSLGRDMLEHYLYDDLYSTVYHLICSCTEDIALPDEQAAAIARFYTLGVAQMVVQWIKQDMPQPVEGFITQLKPIIDYMRTGARLSYPSEASPSK